MKSPCRLVQGTRRVVLRGLEDGTGSTVERADERPLVFGGLHGVVVGYVWSRSDIHHSGHLCATAVVPVRVDLGDCGPWRVQGRFVCLHERHYRVQHHHWEIYLPLLQMRLFR